MIHSNQEVEGARGLRVDKWTHREEVWALHPYPGILLSRELNEALTHATTWTRSSVTEADTRTQRVAPLIGNGQTRRIHAQEVGNRDWEGWGGWSTQGM
jgi:hypothetical protein